MLSFIKWAPVFSRSYSLFVAPFFRFTCTIHDSLPFLILTCIDSGVEGGGYPFSPAEERFPLYKWTERMMGLCCFIYFLLIHPVMFGDLYPHSLPPPQLLVVSHVAVMLLLFTTGRLTLIFALPWLSVLCWLLFTSCPSPPSSMSLPCPSLSPLHCLRLTCNDLFHAFLIFILTSPPLPISLPLLLFSPSFFNACDVCIGLFWCDQSSTPKFARKIKTPAHTKTLHHDWLLPPGDDLPCPLPPPVCPPPACPALP